MIQNSMIDIETTLVSFSRFNSSDRSGIVYIHASVNTSFIKIFS